MANILSIAQSGLMAAQAGLATTGHNIANQNTVGYNRQVVVQAAVAGQNEGGGFIGKGSTVVAVNRVYSAYLGDQLRSVNTIKGRLDGHYTEAVRINNLLADQTSGLAPVLQDFFSSVNAVAKDASMNPARVGMLAAAESMAGRFQSLNGQLQDMREGVNQQITTIVGSINSYVEQIAHLNDAIGKAQGATPGQLPNDLYDQRDLLVSELSKLTQVNVIKDDVNYTVFIGNGQPMVVGLKAFQLQTMESATDPTRLEVGYVGGNGTAIPITESSLPGGKLGGLFEFRATTLDNAQNALGRIAIGLAATFNDQHRLGQDVNGNPGGDFFFEAQPVTQPNKFNTSTAMVNASIVDVSKLTGSDYSVSRDSTGNYTVTRLMDKAVVYSGAAFPNAAALGALVPPQQSIDGIDFAVAAGPMANGDNFIVKPTINGAGSFRVLVTDQANIASGVPVKTEFDINNAGSGKITAPVIDPGYLTPATSAASALPATLVYNDVAEVGPPVIPAKSFTGFPASGTFPYPYTVTVTPPNGSGAPVPYTINSVNDAIPYTPGATITFGGVSFKITGLPADNDKFTVGKNLNAPSDNNNISLLASLQNAKTLVNGTTTYQGAFGQLVSQVGNKTHELEVTKAAEDTLMDQLTQAQQSESGVNLDEEAANLIRYQQAYQAAAKIMQAVKEMFDLLASIH